MARGGYVDQPKQKKVLCFCWPLPVLQKVCFLMFFFVGGVGVQFFCLMSD